MKHPFALCSHCTCLCEGSRQLAGLTRPTHSPKPIRRLLSLSHQAFSVTSSPSSRKLRVSPLGSSSCCLPPSLISRSEPSPPALSVDKVPVPIRSPGCRLQPLLL